MKLKAQLDRQEERPEFQWGWQYPELFIKLWHNGMYASFWAGNDEVHRVMSYALRGSKPRINPHTNRMTKKQ